MSWFGIGIAAVGLIGNMTKSAEPPKLSSGAPSVSIPPLQTVSDKMLGQGSGGSTAPMTVSRGFPPPIPQQQDQSQDFMKLLGMLGQAYGRSGGGGGSVPPPQMPNVGGY